MKRTRRIEITRYRRTVTVSAQDEHIADDSEEITVVETAANEWEVLRRGDDFKGDRLVKRAAPSEVKLTRTPFNFRRWLRQKF